MSCGCVWEHTEQYGDVIVEQCDDHRRQADKIARRAEAASDIIDSTIMIRHELDRELDKLIRRR